MGPLAPGGHGPSREPCWLTPPVWLTCPRGGRRTRTLPSLLAGDPPSVPALRPELGRRVPCEDGGARGLAGLPLVTHTRDGAQALPHLRLQCLLPAPSPSSVSQLRLPATKQGDLSGPCPPAASILLPGGAARPSETSSFLTLSKSKFGGPSCQWSPARMGGQRPEMGRRPPPPPGGAALGKRRGKCCGQDLSPTTPSPRPPPAAGVRPKSS